MKKIVLVCFSIVLANVAWAQIDTWYGVDLGRIGYRYNSLKLNTVSYTNKNFISDDYYGDSASVSLGSVDLSSEIYGKNAYFFLDASLIPNLIQGLVSKKRLAEKLALAPQGRLDIVEMMPVRLAFGGPVTKNVAVYGGGQWMYSMFLSDDVNNYPVIVGGNQRGAGVHVVYGDTRLLLRYSFMYDWIRRQKRQYQGIAITHEASAAYALSEGGNFGLIVRAAHRFREMEDGYMHPSQDYNDSHREMVFVPKLQASDFFFTIGFYLEGLFSGTTRTISNTTYDVYTK